MLSLVATVTELRSMRDSYLRLRNLGMYARYDPSFRPRRADIEAAIRVDLEAVRRAVLVALGVPL